MCNREVVADGLISRFFYILDIKSVIVKIYFDSITKATGDTKKARFSRPHGFPPPQWLPGVNQHGYALCLISKACDNVGRKGRGCGCVHMRSWLVFLKYENCPLAVKKSLSELASFDFLERVKLFL